MVCGPCACQPIAHRMAECTHRVRGYCQRNGRLHAHGARAPRSIAAYRHSGRTVCAVGPVIRHASMRSPTRTFFAMLLVTVVAAGLAGWAGVQVGLGKAAGEADL